jgi:hypothetical protein
LIHTTSTHTNTGTDIYDTHAKFRVRGICQTIRTMKQRPKRWLGSSDERYDRRGQGRSSSQNQNFWKADLLKSSQTHMNLITWWETLFANGSRRYAPRLHPCPFLCQIANSTLLSLYRRLQR